MTLCQLLRSREAAERPDSPAGGKFVSVLTVANDYEGD